MNGEYVVPLSNVVAAQMKAGDFEKRLACFSGSYDNPNLLSLYWDNNPAFAFQYTDPDCGPVRRRIQATRMNQQVIFLRF